MDISGYDDLSVADQNRVRHAMHRLLFEGSLQAALPDDRDDYKLLQQNLTIANTILGFLDVRLINDRDHEVLRFEPLEDPDGFKSLATRDTLTVLVKLREELETHYQRTNDSSCQVTVQDIYSAYQSEWSHPLSQNKLRTILRELKLMKLVHYTGALDRGDTAVLLLPLLFILTPQRLERLAASLRGENPETGEEN